MRASVFVGRVGGLAVALGIGAAAMVLSPGVAGASPDDSTDSSARSGSAAAGSTRDGTSGSRSGAGRSAAQETFSGGRQSGGVKGARGTATTNGADSGSVMDRVEADRLTSAPPAEAVLLPVRVSTEVVEDRLIRPAAFIPVEVIPAAPTIVSLVPGVAETVPAAPVMAPAVAAAASLEAVDGGWSGLVPGGPGESAASWVMVAASRRETRSRAIVVDTAARTVAAGGVPDAEKLPAAAAAAVVGGDSVQAVTPSTAEVSVDPITAIVQQVQAVISGIVEAVTQFMDQVVTVVNQIVTAIVNIFVPVAPVNSAPTATTPNVGVPDPATGVVTGLVAAIDVDGDTLTYSAPASTTKGSVSIDASTGAFVYTPTVAARANAAKVGATAADKEDSFIVTVSDGNGGSVGVVVAVAIRPLAADPINSAPVAGTPTIGTPEATSGAVIGKVNASDPDGDSLIYSAPASTSKGSIIIDASTGAFTYTPTVSARQNAAQVGAANGDKSDSFTVTISDGQGGSTTAVVTVAILPTVTTPSNNAPIAGTPTVGTPNPSTGVVVGQVNATDPDGDTLTYSGPATTSKGTVLVNSNGSFTYTPTPTARHNAARDGAGAADLVDTFTATVSDGKGGSAIIPVIVGVAPVNVAPVADAPVVGTPDPSTGAVTGVVIATDADGDTLTYGAPASTSKGSISIDSSNGAFTYTPTLTARHAAANPGVTESDQTDTFTVTIADGHGGVTALQVTVTIAATAAPRPGDIRAQPDGNWRAMYAPGVSVGNNWIGVNPANGGIWLKDSEVNSWLDVEGPTGTETSGDGPYSPGDIKVPPGSVAGSVMFFMVKSGPPLSDVAVWMACSTYNACHAVKESHLQMGMGWDGVPYSEWVDLRIT